MMVPITSCGLFLLVFTTATRAQYRDGDIRLIGGSYPWEGRVEINFYGIWGTITDRNWTSDDARAVCRHLGYFKPGAYEKTRAYFGSGSGPIHLDYVDCSGTEYNFTDCLTGNKTWQSSHSDDVGVKCQTIDSSYQEGSIRLVKGINNWEGRVEIFYSGTWSAISDTSWTSSDATVVCRQLQHSAEGAETQCCDGYWVSPGPILVSSVSCSGTEGNITSCSYSNSTVYDHQYDVEVKCKQGEVYHDGDIRLVGGSYSWEGRVEIYLNGEWGTISNNIFGFLAAHVVCRQLGYDTRYGYADVSHRFYAGFGEGSGPIHMTNPNCIGTEYKLIDCNYQSGTFSHHIPGWSVSCKNDFPSDREVRLYNLATHYTGRGLLKVYLDNEWGTVVDNGTWTDVDGEVVCRQLGFELPSNPLKLDINTKVLHGETTPIHMSDVQCSGKESRLTECPYTSGGNGSVTLLNCYSYSFKRCHYGQFRLVGGETEMEGRVEMCTPYYGWGTVCNKQWTPSVTKVVCRSLGYSDTEGSYEASHTFGGPVIPILMDYVNCSGSEVGLWDCLHFTHSYSGCSHSDDAGVRCQPVQCDDGDVRVLTGEASGPIEVCFNKTWAKVCFDEWSDVDATVACRQLGYDSGTRKYIRVFHGKGQQIVRLSCFGPEYRLSDCGHTLLNYEDSYCFIVGIDDTEVSCNLADCVDGEMRLMEGEFEWEGRLEVCIGQRWGTVSSDGWTKTNNGIVCHDLGYVEPDTDTDYPPPRTATKSMPAYINYVQCTGKELNLLDCSHSKNHNNNNHSKDVGVQCKEATCDDGDLRLFGGESESEGLLEVCFSQRWGTVNGDGWTYSDAQVACRQLGFEGDSNSYGRKGILSGPIFMDSVACYGSEDKLIYCTYNTDTTAGSRLNQIWIQCDIKSESTSPNEKKSTSTTSVAALALSLIALGISVLVMVFLIGHILYRYKSKPCINESSIRHQRKKCRSAKNKENVQEQTNSSYEAVGEIKSVTPYQQLASSTMQGNGDYENMQKLEEMKQGVDGRHGLRSQPGQVTLDDQVYDIAT